MLVFDINTQDEDLLRQAKQEANIELASVFTQYGVDSKEYIACKSNMRNLINITSVIAGKCRDKKELDYIYSCLNKLHSNGLLSHLTLKDSEFKDIGQGVSENIRYPYIYKIPSGQILVGSDNMFSIVNRRAYVLNIKNCYDHNANKQLETNGSSVVNSSERVYISKGGVVTPECIYNCIIRPEIVSREHFIVREPINLPVSAIIHNGESVYCVDSREPKLKVLQEFYYVPIYVDEDIKGVYNIRNYEKLVKKAKV